MGIFDYFKSNKKDKLVKTYHENGQLKEEGDLKEGEAESLAKILVSELLDEKALEKDVVSKNDKLERMAWLREQMDLIDSILGKFENISDEPKANSNTKKSNEFNIEEGDLEIYLMYEGTLFTYFNDNEDEMTFEAFGLIVECPGNEDYEGEVKDALGKLVFTDKGDSLETYLITDLPEDIVDYEFTNSVGNLHDEALNSMEEAVDFIKNLKTISFKEINPKDGESIRYIN